jgi:MFS family permease
MVNKKNIRLAQSAAFLRSCLFYLPILSLYFIRGGATLETLVIAQVVYSAVTLLFELPTGIFADKFGNKSAIVLGYVFGALALVAGMTTSGGVGAVVFYILFALGDSFISGSEQAYIYQQTKADNQAYKKEYGLLLGLQSVALAFSSALVALLMFLRSDTSYMLLLALTLAIYVVALVLSLGMGSGSESFRKSTKPVATQPRLVRDTLAEIRTNRIIRALFVLSVLTVSGEYFLYSVYQPYFVDHGISESMIAVILSAGAVVNFFVLRNFFKLEQHMKFENIVLVYSALVAVLFAAMSLWQSQLVLIGAFVLLRGLFNALNPVVSDYLQSASRSSIHATLLSAVSLGQSIVGIVLRLILAFVIGSIGVSFGLGVYSVYLIIGSVIAVQYLRACGCVGRINHFE